MIMPFLRLVLIYVVVILAAVIFFNRDSVLPMVGWPWFEAEEGTSVSPDAAVTPTEMPTETSAAPNSKPEIAPAPESAPEPAPKPADPQKTEAPTQDTPPSPTNNAQVKEIDATQTPAPAPAATQPTPKTDAELQALQNKARQAYMNRDFAKTEALYKSMAATNPNNVNILGELGNLYYSQRRMDDAATYYLSAGKQLIRQGNPNQAMSLIGVLQNIAPAKAQELRNFATASQ